MLFGLIGWIILGLIAGLIAKAIMPGKDPGGFIITALIGIVGSVIGGFLGRTLLGYGRDSTGDISEPGFLMSPCWRLSVLSFCSRSTGDYGTQPARLTLVSGI